MKSVLTVATTALLTSVGTAQGSGLEQTPEFVVPTTLEAMRAEPDAFKGVWITFPVQFCSVGRIANPFFTRFVPSQYANFYGWSIDQPIWRKPAYDDLFGMLFMQKENEQITDLYDLELYDRVQVTGVVRNVFQSKPWIEVMSFENLPEKVSTATLSHLFRGELHMERREWNRAVSELSMAPAKDAPRNVRAQVHRNLGVCYLRLGESGAARSHLDSAIALMDEPDRETNQLLTNARSAPELELDRKVDSSRLGDHERPLWEVFESGAGGADSRNARPTR